MSYVTPLHIDYGFDFAAVSSSLCAGGFVPLLLGTALPRELSFSRNDEILVKRAARLVLVRRALFFRRTLVPRRLCGVGVLVGGDLSAPPAG